MLRVDEETHQKEEELNIALTSMDPLIATEFTTEIPEEEGVTILSFFDNLSEKEPVISSQKIDTYNADNKDTEQTDKKEANLSVRPLTRRPSIKQAPARRPSIKPAPARRPSIKPKPAPRPSAWSPARRTSITRSPARRQSVTRSPFIRRPSTELSTTEITTEIPADEESTTLSLFDLSDEKETEMTTEKDINQADNKDTSSTQSPRTSSTQSPRRRPTNTRSPARRPKPVQIDNSQRPIQNRRLDDDRHSSGNFLPDQKFPTNVLRPTQFLRPVQRPVPQIVERPPQEEIIFNQEDEKLQIQPEEEQQQIFNVQNEDQAQSLGGIVNDNTTIISDISENTDLIIQDENPQSSSLIPLVPLPHPVCREAGLLPDRLRCMVFHECVIENGQWQLYSWRCKRGHYYDPHTVSCQRGRCNL